MTERFVQAGWGTLWTESFGDPKNPAILLIMGFAGQGIVWPDLFCHLLAQHGFFVIRYDNRDTGKSSSIDYSTNPYALEDMATDAITILDAYGIDKASIIGASMGGTIAQIIARGYPERISHLVLIMSTPDLSVIVRSIIPFFLRPLTRLFLGLGFKRGDVPGPKRQVVNFFRSQLLFPLKNNHKKIEIAVNGWKIFSGGGLFNEDEMRRLEERSFLRSQNYNAFLNHARAIMQTAKNEIDLGFITQPTLITHGELDPVFPVSHAQMLAQKIPNAQLAVINEMGHILPEALSEKLVTIIVAFLRSS